MLFPHILCMMHGIAIPHAVISSAARNLFRPPFPSSFAKPFTGNTVHLSAIRCFPFLAVRRSPSYRQRKRSLGSARDDDTGNVLFPHILCMMHEIAIPHAVISSAARNLFRPLFSSSFAKPFTGNTVRLPAIRCFPFLAVRRSSSYRQRKRSLGSARDDDTGNVLFPHILCMMHGIAIPHAVISSVARNLFRPSFPSSFAKPFTGSTAPAFPRYGVSRFSPSDALRLTANEKDPSTSLGMTIRETRLFHFPRYGVSCFSPSGTLRLTINEKDPSAPLPMTIRGTCFSHTFFV